MAWVRTARVAPSRRDPSWRPHVRLVGVNVNTDREFGVALLRFLSDEMRRRADAAKQHEVTKLEELRAVDPSGRWPRIVAVIDEFGIAARGEYVSDPDGYLSGYFDRNEEIKLVSGTLTLEVLPADFLTVRLDNRIDWSSKQIFNEKIRDLTGTQFTTTLGVVGHTD